MSVYICFESVVEVDPLPKRIVIVDTETTHYDPSVARVIEIGAVVVDTSSGRWRVVDEFGSLCNPGERYLVGAERALEISGITKEQVLSAPDIRSVAERFWKFLDRHKGAKLTGYNTNYYDSKVLSREPWAVPGRMWDRGRDVMLIAFEAMQAVDPCPLEYMPQWGKYKWPRLEEAARHYGVLDQEQDHRAVSDCLVTMRLMEKLHREGWC